MKAIMEYFILFIFAAAIVVALATLIAWAGLHMPRAIIVHPPAAAPTTPKPIQIAALGEVCVRDGVLITSQDRLRAAVTLADTMIVRGDLHGHPMPMQIVRRDADEFAAKQSEPDVTLALLERCDDSLLHRYPHGYWLISAALVRASVAKRNAGEAAK